MTLHQIFCVFIDKLTGKNVSWYKRGYEAVKNDHPEVGTHLEVVKGAVENPSFVKQDADRAKRNAYYAPYSGGREYPNHHMKVIVAEDFLGRLRVITAYFVDHFKEGESLVWSKN